MRRFGIKLLCIFVIFFHINCDKSDCNIEGNCKLSPEQGPCLGNITKYYYDIEERKCKQFIWGGCEGVVPFNSLEECEENCTCR